MTISLKEIGRYRVFAKSGRKTKYIGRAIDALFCPDESRLCGIVVQPPRFFFVWDRAERYLAFDRAEFLPEHELYVAEPKGAWGKQAAKRLGLDWERTVVWLGMPVRTESGKSMGVVRDGLLSDAGQLEAIGLSGGVATDAAVGVRDLPASLVKGFETDAVVLLDKAAVIETSGGAAAAAGKGAAVAKQQIGEVTAGAVSFGKAAANAAAKSDTGKKAMGWLKSIKDEIVDAMGEDDED